ncbi:MAG: Obg family GTPase CgtA [Chloroflexi bacterium]|nr:Obg family GTPase CgtA [Chloroflexota bacterium]
MPSFRTCESLLLLLLLTMFRDTVALTVIGGTGGNGCASFRRTRAVPRGGPDGGKGGEGGAVVLVGRGGVKDLGGLRPQAVLQGQRGGHGSSRNKNGKRGAVTEVEVPLGTVVWESSGTGGEVALGELLEEEQQLVVAKGGSGGRGNLSFATARVRAPLLAEAGEQGETRLLRLELWSIADVGMVGQPNSGRSLLLRKMSHATPATGAAPFTTQEPCQGVVFPGWSRFTLIDVPGLVAGAHQGAGLGHRFLKHLFRTRLLLHVVDGSAPEPVRLIQEVNAELALFADALRDRPQLIVVNKVDLPETRQRLLWLREVLAPFGVARHFVSAETGEGVDALVADVARRLDGLPNEGPLLRVPAPVLRPRSVVPPVKVTRSDAVFVVSSLQAERLVALADLRQFPVRLQLRHQFKLLGVIRALEEAGVRAGDRVRIGSIELLWE